MTEPEAGQVGEVGLGIAGLVAPLIPAAPAAAPEVSTPANPVAVIKLMTFTTDPGFTPNYGDVSADFRGNPGQPGSLFIGSAQGDEHHCVKQWNISDDEITAFLAAAPLVNAKLKQANGNALVADLDKLLGGLGFLGGIVSEIVSLWPAPSWRVGLWYPHA